MSNYDELLARISTANAKCNKLNEELRVREGKRQAFSTQLESAIADYKAKYGVDLTPSTIDEELARVSQSVEVDLKDLENLIALIETGRYDEANAIVGAGAEVPVQNVEPTAEPVHTEPVQPTTQVQSTLVQPVEPMQSAPVQPTVPVQPLQGAPSFVETPVQSVPIQPVAPNTPVAPVHPSTPVTPVAPSTPVTPIVPAPSSQPNGLDGMLGGALAGFQPASASVHPTAPPISGLGGIQPTVNQQASPTNFQDILNGSAFGVK